MPNSYKLLLLREYNNKHNLRLNLKIVQNLVCHNNSKFTKVWEKHDSQPITYEGGKLFFENNRTCYCVHGADGLPTKLYKLPTPTKVKDCLIAQTPLDVIPLEHAGYRSSMLVVTSRSYLLRFDLDTGKLLECVFISPKYNFVAIAWNVLAETVFVKSTHTKKSSIARQRNQHEGRANVLIVFCVFNVFPLQCKAMLEIHDNVFGRDVVDASISQDMLIVMHTNNQVVRLYSFEWIVQQYKVLDLELDGHHPRGEGLIGRNPHGIPCNIQITERPPVLFEVKCAQHKLCMGGFPWHYIISERGHEGKFNLHRMDNQQPVANGTLYMEGASVEEDKCFFHTDESGRILHTGPHTVKMLGIVEDKNVSSEYKVEEVFTVSAVNGHQTEQQAPEEDISYTSSGRPVKKPIHRDSFYDNTCESIQTVDYEEDIDVLVITSVQQVEDHYEGKVHLYHNLTGALIKQIPLQEHWEPFCDHVVALDLDTLVHIVKSPGRCFHVYVYRLDRLDGSTSETSKGKTRSRRNQRQSLSRSSRSNDGEESSASGSRRSRSSGQREEGGAAETRNTYVVGSRRITRSHSAIR